MSNTAPVHLTWPLRRRLRARGIALVGGLAFGVVALLILQRQAQIAEGQPASRPERQIVPGVTHEVIVDAEAPRVIHVARIARDADLRLAATLARGQVFGLAGVSKQVARAPRPGWRPVVAVNADFYVIRKEPYQGDPLGLHAMAGELISGPAGRSCLMWDDDGRFAIGAPEIELWGRFGGQQHPIAAVNRRPIDDALTLYTPRCGPSTHTPPGVAEVALHRASGSLPISGTVTTEAHGRAAARGDHGLPQFGFVIAGEGQAASSLLGLRRGDDVVLGSSLQGEAGRFTHGIGGNPVLVHDGKAAEFNSRAVHPRTAVGFNDDTAFLVTVDGRRPGYSKGMSMAELARFMRGLGCREALNLDGGGSTTMWIDGEVVNRPSDGRERSVANALVVLRRENSR